MTTIRQIEDAGDRRAARALRLRRLGLTYKQVGVVEGYSPERARQKVHMAERRERVDRRDRAGTKASHPCLRVPCGEWYCHLCTEDAAIDDLPLGIRSSVTMIMQRERDALMLVVPLKNEY